MPVLTSTLHPCLHRISKQGAFEDMAIAQLTELATFMGDDLAMLWFDAGVKQGTEFVDRINAWVKDTLPGSC